MPSQRREEDFLIMGLTTGETEEMSVAALTYNTSVFISFSIFTVTVPAVSLLSSDKNRGTD